MVCIGDNSKKLMDTFHKSVTNIYHADTIEEATQIASILAQENDVVLFSPACPSNEETFETRGNRFINAVKQLENEHHQ